MRFDISYFMTCNIYSLLYTWKPPKLLVRDQELNTLITSVHRPAMSRYIIYGDNEMGKTLTITILKDIVEGEGSGKLIYVPCYRKVNMTAEVLANRLGAKNSNETSVALQLKTLADEYGRIIIVFDDVDKIIGYMYYFDRYIASLHDLILKDYSKYSMILISTIDYMKLTNKLEISQRKYYFKPLPFVRYTKDQMKKILYQRLQYTNISYGDKDIDEIINFTYRIGKGIRFMLDLTLDSTVDCSITLKKIKEAEKERKIKYWYGQIKSLPQHQRILLWQIVDETHSLTGDKPTVEKDGAPLYPFINWGKIKRRYFTTCYDLNINPLSERQLYNLLDDMRIKGWINTKLMPFNIEGKHTKKREIHIRLLEKIENLKPTFKLLAEQKELI